MPKRAQRPGKGRGKQQGARPPPPASVELVPKSPTSEPEPGLAESMDGESDSAADADSMETPTSAAKAGKTREVKPATEAGGTGGAESTTAAPGTVLLCQISICRKASSDVKWFKTLPLLGRGEQPCGPWCWDCGTACEVFPLKSKEEIAKLVETRADWRNEFRAVRAGVEKAFAQLQPRESVFRDRQVGCRVLCKLAFVVLDILAAAYSQTVGTLSGVKTTELTGPENTPLQGVLFTIDAAFLAKGLPHFIVEMWSDEILTFQRSHLHETEILRPQHASDLYEFHAAKTIRKRDPCLKLAKLSSSLTISAYATKVDEKQQELHAAESMAAQQTAATDLALTNVLPDGISGLGQLRSGSRLDSDDEKNVTPSKAASKRKSTSGGIFISRPSSGSMAAPSAAAAGRKRPGSGVVAASSAASMASEGLAMASRDGPVGKRRRTPEEKDAINIHAIFTGYQAGRELNPADWSDFIHSKYHPSSVQ